MFEPSSPEREPKHDGALLSDASGDETDRSVAHTDQSFSDVVPVDSITAGAPPFRPPGLAANSPQQLPMSLPPAPPRDPRPEPLLPGARIDDFQIVQLLGRGGFGNVYLARQLSLDRLVALKVSANRGSEGR